MHDDELRLLVREAVARHLGGGSHGAGAAFGERALPSAAHGAFDGRAGSLGAEAPGAPKPRGEGGLAKAAPNVALSWKTHQSHGRFVFLAPTEPDAPCVVEPEVRCHHCGFCQSYGH